MDPSDSYAVDLVDAKLPNFMTLIFHRLLDMPEIVIPRLQAVTPTIWRRIGQLAKTDPGGADDLLRLWGEIVRMTGVDPSARCAPAVGCGARGEGGRKAVCGKCRFVEYCGDREHQRADWPTHRRVCALLATAEPCTS